MQHWFTLENLREAGLIHTRDVAKWFNRARIRWDLISPTDLAKPQDVSFSYNGYGILARLSCVELHHSYIVYALLRQLCTLVDSLDPITLG